mgnify:FL=1
MALRFAPTDTWPGTEAQSDGWPALKLAAVPTTVETALTPILSRAATSWKSIKVFIFSDPAGAAAQRHPQFAWSSLQLSPWLIFEA